ncbi:hypothetical protein KVT40_002674 [Elsinoe batatas]|uniref:Uncharacterized protein n=1 Tax=Elsinoe batatas TaxID=2601811 RepID=A0A8K0L5E6_9PEZI|nr:hypothetical protein KVT40_002674 [Elsinoe batatas]
MSRGPEKDAELDTDLEELDRKAKERKIQKQRAKQKEDEEKAEATRYAREARRMRERAERAEKALDGIQWTPLPQSSFEDPDEQSALPSPPAGLRALELQGYHVTRYKVSLATFEDKGAPRILPSSPASSSLHCL